MTTPDDRPTPTDGPGWYADPQGTGKERYFDGENWTDRIRTSASRDESGNRPGFMDRVREAPMLVKIGVPVVLVVIIVAAASGGSGSSHKGGDQTATAGQTSSAVTTPANTKDKATTSKAKEAEKVVTEGEDKPDSGQVDETAGNGQKEPEPSRSGPSAEQQLKEALGDKVSSGFAVGDSEVRSVEVAGPIVNVTLQTPSGGFEGPSTDDTDALASAAFAKVFGDAGWRGIARVSFRGGLVDAATGQELPNAPTASYRVGPHAARQIDWSDEEALYNINWSIYRELCHPALKGCPGHD